MFVTIACIYCKYQICGNSIFTLYFVPLKTNCETAPRVAVLCVCVYVHTCEPSDFLDI